MKRSSLFGHVIELHDAIRISKRPADIAASEFFRTRHYLGARDRRFIGEMVFGLLRHFRLLQFYVEGAFRLAGDDSSSPHNPTIALIGAYAIRVAHENIDSLMPDLSGLWRVYVPGTECRTFLELLSAVSLDVEGDHNLVEGLAIRYSLPEVIVHEWIDRLGRNGTELLCAALNSPAPTTIRVNTLATTVEECRVALLNESIDAVRTLLSPVGLKLSKRINAQALQSFKQGYFEMQDEGSQLISMLAGPLPGDTAIDACAGGGGKTLHLAALMSNRGNLFAIDVKESRLNNIRQRLTRAGVSIAHLYLADRDRGILRNWMGKADAVLVDAPCSGVGTFRRNPGAKLTFTETLVDHMMKTQQAVLEEYAAFVKPGGRLVYSTCTLLKKENEEQVERFLSGHADFELLSATTVLSRLGVQVESTDPYLTLLPHQTTTDGFFAAVVARRPT